MSEDALLVGMVGRFHPMKDHAMLLRAAAGVLQRCSGDVYFVLVGRGVDGDNSGLVRAVATLGLGKRCFLLGERYDIPRITAALDVAASSSYSEGFLNALGEAMACGVPCVVTEVGDSAFIVGDTGSVVVPGDHSALVAAIGRLIDLPSEERRVLGEACRARVVSEFGMDSLVQRTEQALGLA